MGGLYVLLAVATMSVTYGWQPDGRGGVEYIVQVPPEELAQLKGAGEITSTIDPAVRGRVSKIIVRVGNADLPRITPDFSSIPPRSIEDHRAVPVPTMTATNVEVLKPDPDSGGLGLPGALGNAAERGADAVRGGTQQMRSSAADAMDRMRSGAANAADQLQSRTGQLAADAQNTANDAMSRVRSKLNLRDNSAAAAQGGSQTRNATAAPNFTGERDKKWFNLDAAQRQTPSTEPMTSADQRNSRFVGPPSPFSRGANPQADRRTTGGFGSSSTFANPPNSNPTTARGSLASGNSNTLRTPKSSSSNLTFAERELRLSQLERQQELERLERERQLERERLSSSMGRGRNDYSIPSTQDTRPTTWNQPSRSIAPATRGYGESNFANDPNSPTRLARNSNLTEPRTNTPEVDPRLTREEARLLPPGGYTFDKYGNPTDREGRILDDRGRVVSRDEAYRLTIGRKNPAFAAPQSSVSPTPFPNPNLSYPNPNTANTYTRAAAPPPTTQPTNPNLVNRAQTQAYSPAPPRTHAKTTEVSSRIDSKKRDLAAQPLFNGLLLMSIVGNIYLIFWLKNLRHQFHDLVASKRVAAGANLTA